jgi:FkbM family methyltransferase
MLIPFREIAGFCESLGIPIKGIVHIGAHECEELKAYKECGIPEEKIAWIEAQKEKVEWAKNRGIMNIFNHCILDVEEERTFWKTTNGESSSVLEFGSHSTHHAHVKVCGSETVSTVTLKRFFEEHPEFQGFNMWNLDIQGVELRAMKSAGDFIKNVDIIYTEVNTEQVYQGCDQLDDMEQWLNQKGFAKACENIYREYGWGDALFIRFSPPN